MRKINREVLSITISPETYSMLEALREKKGWTRSRAIECATLVGLYLLEKSDNEDETIREVRRYFDVPRW